MIDRGFVTTLLWVMSSGRDSAASRRLTPEKQTLAQLAADCSLVPISDIACIT
jgi:hypothetical protein